MPQGYSIVNLASGPGTGDLGENFTCTVENLDDDSVTEDFTAIFVSSGEV